MFPPSVIQRAFLSAGFALALAGCSTSSRQAAEETVTLPARAVEKGAQGIGAIGRGAGQLSENLVGRLLLDRNRHQLLREHRELSGHMAELTTYIRERGVPLEPDEKRILRDAQDGLAVAGRQLEEKRIPAQQGLDIQRHLDKVRNTFVLLRQAHNTPRYRGYIAPR
ncbi:MAG: hypothetical protein O2807_03745 [bacterium]|nr:hypothetical protein [bacterium]